MDAYVAAEQAKIITGEQAISFFAKVIHSLSAIPPSLLETDSAYLLNDSTATLRL